MPEHDANLQLKSHVDRSGLLTLSLAESQAPVPGTDDVLIAVEAAPINPSDLAQLLAGADAVTATSEGEGRARVLRAKLPPQAAVAARRRADQILSVGAEGAGRVVAAGTSLTAQSLRGRLVAARTGSTYGRFTLARADECFVLPPGVTAVEGASCYVNPMTALGMVETLRIEGHAGLVHTAAASNLGQMLNRLCQAEGVALVNVVRRPEQAALLRNAGAVHVCDAGDDAFSENLRDALRATKATLCFDAIGGGRLASDILTAMEAVATQDQGFGRYGSGVRKQAYIYGGLDMSPTFLARTYGMSWSVGGWLLMNFLSSIGPAATRRLRERVVSELKTTFASRYSRTLSLADALDAENVRAFARRSTGDKFLIDPSLVV